MTKRMEPGIAFKLKAQNRYECYRCFQKMGQAYDTPHGILCKTCWTKEK